MVPLDSGDVLYPSMLDDALYEIPGLVDYRAVLLQEEGKSRLKVEAEMRSPDCTALQHIRSRLASIPGIARGIASGKLAEPEAAFADPDELRAAGREKKLIVVRSQ